MSSRNYPPPMRIAEHREIKFIDTDSPDYILGDISDAEREHSPLGPQ
jgi:hypothetical protein